MNRNQLFWGAILLLGGALLLLNNLGILNVDVWGILWPIALILFGINMLWGNRFRFQDRPVTTTAVPGTPSVVTGDQLTIPLEGAAEAEVEFNHGAGRIFIHPGSDPSALMFGTFSGGVRHEINRSGSTARLRLNAPTDFVAVFPFGSEHGYEWNINLNRDVQLSLIVHTGASENHLDLTDLKVTRLKVETGASSTRVQLPVNAGRTDVKVGSGAASINFNVPSGVAARIRYQGALSNVRVNESRFPRSGNLYESPEYGAALNKVDIEIDMGVGSVTID